jgi:hypothetical protein
MTRLDAEARVKPEAASERYLVSLESYHSKRINFLFVVCSIHAASWPFALNHCLISGDDWMAPRYLWQVWQILNDHFQSGRFVRVVSMR